ncbi:MAG: hypothetical protein PHR77_03215 [Kiritimatiellae bacterium]|nr:hypothetical protein [Kiritimatiellia bacterium]MDD5519567.1 hypothetical protein [Kiritimatiellia bacterium]
MPGVTAPAFCYVGEIFGTPRFDGKRDIVLRTRNPRGGFRGTLNRNPMAFGPFGYTLRSSPDQEVSLGLVPEGACALSSPMSHGAGAGTHLLNVNGLRPIKQIEDRRLRRRWNWGYRPSERRLRAAVVAFARTGNSRAWATGI